MVFARSISQIKLFALVNQDLVEIDVKHKTDACQTHVKIVVFAKLPTIWTVMFVNVNKTTLEHFVKHVNNF